MEKTGEELAYFQGPTNTTRMDYLSPLFNELVFSLTTEKLLDIEVPERAKAIRILMTELNRISSHLVALATGGMDIGALSMMIFGFRERELILNFQISQELLFSILKKHHCPSIKELQIHNFQFLNKVESFLNPKKILMP